MSASADDEEDIRLARRESGKARSESVHVVVGAGRRHVFHPAAGSDEGVLKDRVLSRPAKGLIQTAGKKDVSLMMFLHRQFRAPLSPA